MQRPSPDLALGSERGVAALPDCIRKNSLQYLQKRWRFPFACLRFRGDVIFVESRLTQIRSRQWAQGVDLGRLDLEKGLGPS
jgi:hypothetical protein